MRSAWHPTESTRDSSRGDSSSETLGRTSPSSHPSVLKRHLFHSVAAAVAFATCLPHAHPAMPQLLAASCAGSRVSVWAVDFDERASLPSRPQQQEETGSASEPGAAAVALALPGTTPTEELASVTAATSKPGTPAGGATSIAMIPADSSTSPGGYKSTDAKVHQH